MPVIRDHTSQIAWLTARLATHRNRILGLWRRVTGLGHAPSLKPALFAKFSHWLDDIAAAKTEEMNLMTRIEDIERKHRFMRLAKRLKLARPGYQLEVRNEDCEAAPNRPFHTLIWLIVFWYLFMRQKINQKMQGLTVD
jgi:hypothetical protein